MLFNSLEFLVFLPIVFLLYWFVFRKHQWQNLLVVVASYVFYGWWDWRFLILIAITSLSSFASGLLIERFEGQRNRQRWVSAANIVLNVAILGAFKYFNFFVENFEHLVGSWGWQLDCVTMQIILPVGISFYTFQALSYSIDVYQKRLPATHNAVESFLPTSAFSLNWLRVPLSGPPTSCRNSSVNVNLTTAWRWMDVGRCCGVSSRSL